MRLFRRAGRPFISRMNAFDIFLLIAVLANYLIAVPAFLSSGEVPTILIGILLAIAPGFIVFRLYFENRKK